MKEILLHTIAIARSAGEAIMEFYRGTTDVRLKEDDSPVTDADLAANTIIHEGLSKYDWPILSEEEQGETRVNAEYVWIVDPLDGTHSFIERREDFCVMIGLVKHGFSVLGVMYQPTIDKLYAAYRGGGAFCEIRGVRHALHVSGIKDPKKARFVTSKYHPTPVMDTFAKALEVSTMKRVASNGIKLGLIAEGQADLFFNPTNKLGEWDLCAPQVVLEEAGGRMTGTRGEKFVYNKEVPMNPYGILATNGALHAEALQKIQSIIHAN